MMEKESGVVNEWLKANNMTKQQLVEEASKDGNTIPKNVKNALGHMGLIQNYEENRKYKYVEATAGVGEFLDGDASKPPKPGEEKKKTPQQMIMDKLSGVGDRLADFMIKQGAAGEEAGTKSLMMMTDEIKKAAGGAKAFTDAAVESAARLNAAQPQRMSTLPQGDPTGRSTVDVLLGNTGARKPANMSVAPAPTGGKNYTPTGQ
jgi:hypothetical protein